MAELTEEDLHDIEEFEESGEISDHLFGRSVGLGVLIGTPISAVIIYFVLSALDLSTSDEALWALTIWGALWAGVLLGAVVGVGLRLLRMEGRAHQD